MNMYSISFINAIIIYKYVIVLSQRLNLRLRQINKKLQNILRTYICWKWQSITFAVYVSLQMEIWSLDKAQESFLLLVDLREKRV